MKRTFIAACLAAAALLLSCSRQPKETVGSHREQPLLLSNHISNEQINGFAEDRYGQVWISTFRGLNKFDGTVFHQYFCTDDSTGLPDNNVRCA